MKHSKVAISIDSDLLKRLDRLVKERRFSNRSQAIQAAVKDKLVRLDKTRLATECAKLNKKFEKSLAEEGLALDLDEWPAY